MGVSSVMIVTLERCHHRSREFADGVNRPDMRCLGPIPFPVADQHAIPTGDGTRIGAAQNRGRFTQGCPPNGGHPFECDQIWGQNPESGEAYVSPCKQWIDATRKGVQLANLRLATPPRSTIDPA